jgi:hypothetical protein
MSDLADQPVCFSTLLPTYQTALPGSEGGAHAATTRKHSSYVDFLRVHQHQTRIRSNQGMPLSYDAHSRSGKSTPRILTCPGSDFVSGLVEWLGRATRTCDVPASNPQSKRTTGMVHTFYGALLWKGACIRVGDTVTLHKTCGKAVVSDQTGAPVRFTLEGLYEVGSSIHIAVAEESNSVDNDPLLYSSHQRGLWLAGGALRAQQAELCMEPSECRLLAPGRAFMVLTQCHTTLDVSHKTTCTQWNVELRHLSGQISHAPVAFSSNVSGPSRITDSAQMRASVSQVLDMALAGERTWRQTSWAQQMWHEHISLWVDEIGCAATMARWSSPIASSGIDSRADTQHSAMLLDSGGTDIPPRNQSLPRAWTRLLAADFQLDWLSCNPSVKHRDASPYLRSTHEVRVRGQLRRLATCEFCAKICRVDVDGSFNDGNEQKMSHGFTWPNGRVPNTLHVHWADTRCHNHIRQAGRFVAMLQKWRGRIQKVLAAQSNAKISAWSDPYRSPHVLQILQQALDSMRRWKEHY